MASADVDRRTFNSSVVTIINGSDPSNIKNHTYEIANYKRK